MFACLGSMYSLFCLINMTYRVYLRYVQVSVTVTNEFGDFANFLCGAFFHGLLVIIMAL